jgi:hypothetical protein
VSTGRPSAVRSGARGRLIAADYSKPSPAAEFRPLRGWTPSPWSEHRIRYRALLRRRGINWREPNFGVAPIRNLVSEIGAETGEQFALGAPSLDERVTLLLLEFTQNKWPAGILRSASAGRAKRPSSKGRSGVACGTSEDSEDQVVASFVALKGWSMKPGKVLDVHRAPLNVLEVPEHNTPGEAAMSVPHTEATHRHARGSGRACGKAAMNPGLSAACRPLRRGTCGPAGA